ncbi:MAG: twin-arginine translocation signal domain-containing protein, partial [Cyclobacteriaceae bacterium]|nr:twin-arginine translocation signal domain-containing protein [Cyclobacteriaceae bacterium]
MNQRRNFIKASALIAGGAVISPFSLPKAFASGDDVIKIALIGCGGRGTGAVFQAFETGYNIKLVAMADAFQDRLEGSYKPIFEKYGKDKVEVTDDKKFVGFEAYKDAIKEADVVI